MAGITFLAVSPLLLGELSSEGLRPLAHAGFWTPAVLALAALGPERAEWPTLMILSAVAAGAGGLLVLAVRKVR